ncbi:hypothetical protein [Georgenia sp. H159]|uniref:hypothetical protein n=1 Tax=Georgenia sp. H159 TaxID=3076115 RepID=UPI002D79F177|nr:hypothetical protein [Georgenia sp. H159]
MTKHDPLGPNGRWKTGQRVPSTGLYFDQYNVVTHHEAGATFPPCIGRKGEAAYRLSYEQYMSSADGAAEG